ncbi:hypothetical protein [Fontisphaera persica]
MTIPAERISALFQPGFDAQPVGGLQGQTGFGAGKFPGHTLGADEFYLA